MVSFKIIPAIDLMEGQCVRLLQGDYKTRNDYDYDPVDLARIFLNAGLDRLHVVDLDGAKAGRPMNLDTVTAIAETGIQIELGGGIRTEKDIQHALDAGAKEVILGSTLIEQRTQAPRWVTCYSNRLVAGVDVRQGRIATHGWQKTTQQSVSQFVAWLEEIGFRRLIYTDITTDGTLSGPSLKQLETVARSTRIEVTASGGIGSVEDIQAVKKLQPHGITGVIVGKAFYEGKISIKELAAC
ncbi:1-(5-phosphoribosyl)-5-[(5-phosphoribosylamino)methylideneamino]imidazole-4-carboxamide isomerase [Candidatus Neomarinimicrobiota bacterium]